MGVLLVRECGGGGGKIVIAPSVWQKDEYCGGEIDIYREEMIKIDVD